MDMARETAKEIEGGPTSVRNVLSGSGAGGITFWGVDLFFFGSDVPEAGWSARSLPQTDGRADGKTAEGRDLEKRGSGKSAQGSGNPDNRDVH